MHAFKHIIDQAIELGVAAVFGAGDLIDVRKPSSEVIEFIRDEMCRLEEVNIPFYFIQGQHELAEPPWFLAAHRWPIWVDFETVEVEGYAVHGLDWTPADQLSTSLLAVPRGIDILLAHQVWEEFMGNLCGCEGSFSQVPTPIMFTGDFHSEQYREDFRGATGQMLTIISPGATNIRTINEPARHHYYLFGDDGWDRQQIPGRRVIGHTILSEDGLDGALETFQEVIESAIQGAKDDNLPDQLQMPIVWAKYPEDVPDAYDRLGAAAGDNCHLFRRPVHVVGDDVMVERQKRQEVVSGGLAGCLELIVNPKKEKKDYKVLTRLISCSDPKLELQSMRKERGL